MFYSINMYSEQFVILFENFQICSVKSCVKMDYFDSGTNFLKVIPLYIKYYIKKTF